MKRKSSTVYSRRHRCPGWLDEATLRTMKAATKTRDKATVLWTTAAAAFAHVTVGPSMYDVDEETGDVFLSKAAVNGNWSKSVAAQLKFTLTPGHPVFSESEASSASSLSTE